MGPVCMNWIFPFRPMQLRLFIISKGCAIRRRDTPIQRGAGVAVARAQRAAHRPALK